MGKEWFVEICLVFYDVIEKNMPNGGIIRCHEKNESKTKILTDVFFPTIEFVTKYCDSLGNVNKAGLRHLENNADINIVRVWEDLVNIKDIHSYYIKVESAKLVERETSVKEKFLREYTQTISTVNTKNTKKMNPNSISVFTGEQRKIYKNCPNITNRYHDCSKYCLRWKPDDKCVPITNVYYKKQCKYGKWCVKNKNGTCTFKH